MFDIKVYNNLLPKQFADDIEGVLLSNNTMWYLQTATVNEKEPDYLKHDNKTTESVFFSHGFYKDGAPVSPWYVYFINLVNTITSNPAYSKYDLHRCKANLYLKESAYPEDHHHTAHRDDDNNTGAITALYFANDSDGDTFFFDDNMNIIQKVSPKKNSVVIFPSNILHCGSPPRINNLRTNINIVLRPNTQ